MKHQWHETVVKDHDGNEYQAFHCDKCDYHVIAFEHEEITPGGSMHLPEQKMILVGKKSITAEEAEFATVVWGVECKVG